MIHYNEMLLASGAELAIAKALETERILFFPLPLAVKADTGDNLTDNREPDFLIYHQKKWAILEVVGEQHTGRITDDEEKRTWFERQGLRVIWFSREKCVRNAKGTVKEFLQILHSS